MLKKERGQWWLAGSGLAALVLVLLLGVLASCTAVGPAPGASGARGSAGTGVQYAAAAGTPGSQSGAAQAGLHKLNHIVVILQENWSFDSLFPSFPGANGIAAAGYAVRQVDAHGQPLAALPQPKDTSHKPPVADARFPTALPVQPYDLAKYVPATGRIGDLLQRFYQEQSQIDGGKMDKFVSGSDNGGLTLGYYNAQALPEGQLAQQYTLADNFFHAAYGGSLLNHFWLICACTPTWPNAPANMVAKLDANGVMTKDGAVTPDGYVINTVYSINTPHPATITDTHQLLPALTAPTIGDRLSAQGITWAWYSGGWKDAVAGHPDPLFQFNHQPFAYFTSYADGTPGRAAHLKDEEELRADLQNHNLPSVAFVKALGSENEHPGYADLFEGQMHTADLVKAIQDSPYWPDTAIIIAYDENGGFWDHVAPPKVDRWGPGARVPAVIISPYARHGYVDHTQYDTTSILKLIEDRWGLPPLGARDAAANGLENAFDFSQQAGK